MTSRKEALPAINNFLTVRRTVEKGRCWNERMIDLTNPDAPYPTPETVEKLLIQIRGVEGNRNPQPFFMRKKNK